MPTPIRVALVGGDERAGFAYPDGVEVRRYGSSGSCGNGGLKRVLQALSAGRIDAVLIIVRWLGHSESRSVRAACQRAGILCRIVSGGESSVVRAVRDLLNSRKPSRLPIGPRRRTS